MLFSSPDCRMMLNKVPRLTGSWSGTGTVIVVPSTCFCMILWLPRWRASTNPFCSKILQVSEPERTRSLPNRHLDLGYEYFALKSPGNLRRRCRFKKQGKRLDEIGACLFNRCALAGDVQLRTQRYESVVFAFNDRGHLSSISHDLSVRLPWDRAATRIGAVSRKSIKFTAPSTLYLVC